ncbi:MAG: hypothetical protein IKQ29_00340 [Bacilli bacterium]|nr:hypothetical protein [Bacilli bacterium]
MAKKKKEKCCLGNYLFLMLLVLAIIISTIGIHAAKVVDVAEYFVNMKEISKTDEYKDMVKNLKDNYDEERAKGEEEYTLRSSFGVDSDVKLEDSFLPIYNYAEVRTIDKYIKRVMLFAVVSTIFVFLSVYMILNDKKYLLLFALEILGIIVLFPITKSNIYPLCFLYLPILGIAYWVYYNKIYASK